MIPHFASAREMASLLARQEISAVETLEGTLARIVKLDEHVNAVVVRDFERARIAAEEADRALARGERRPLLGVPITVKESFNVAGLRTTWGVKAFRDWQPRAESLAVERLRQAGAVILGKTNVSEGLADWQCGNEIFGTTNNPWNPAYTCGGSSGGSAAAIAMGFSFLELGSDLAGSIRIPAHFCGVCGHRPSYGILSAEGYGFPSTVASSDLSTIGPLARTTDDLSLAVDILAGPGRLESTVYQLRLPPARQHQLGAFRVLVLPDHPLVPTSHALRHSLLRVAEEIQRTGATVATESPLLPNLGELTRVCLRLLVPLTLSRVSQEQYQRTRERVKELSPADETLTAIGLRAGVCTHRDWLYANEARARFNLQWRRLFRDWDVVLCPVSATAAFPHDQRPPQERRLQVDGTTISYFDQIAWSSFATACGLPATVIPVSRTPDGMPIGVQIIGPSLEDHTTLRFAQRLEERLGGFTEPALN